MNMQTKFMDEFERIAEELNIDFVVNKEYANTGRVYYQHKWETLMQFTYYFDTTGVTFKGIDRYSRVVYDNPSKIEALFFYVRDTLTNELTI